MLDDSLNQTPILMYFAYMYVNNICHKAETVETKHFKKKFFEICNQATMVLHPLFQSRLFIPAENPLND